ncbi:2-oxo-4-hydroxy-4-carboxy-5-ureidoimidazoline decarboxylase [Endozoicomonas gorgoniicola]|uniref:2-oxo-4-hydroxy-4-carboxy-5-ureidoimidazoline decarboxylase n=1 Tax=Endozoicomonas gorgoniicola TaxID=1234144 RepID=A0ABT3MVT9_9GAMM|nr:2-oxo-4-hydroxy-4-carboxy-5-ureidoimidazoline decarboxylase [Endozoicomonas gorgoniicola]MCW7553465.1 2-oxo-4-hydroxy-4-carboxy-5-ureidoimidazoline decarboxylase [Endozoicomonas gorgoniicola]
MTLELLNATADSAAQDFFFRCCTSERWVRDMVSARPFSSQENLLAKADECWQQCDRNDILRAFEGHPKIGDINSLKAKYANTSQMAGHEQSGTEGADDKTLNALADGNRVYEERFGYIFIVCATGKSATEMLALLQERLDNQPEDELIIAAAEQQKITRIRLNKLINEAVLTS